MSDPSPAPAPADEPRDPIHAHHDDDDERPEPTPVSETPRTEAGRAHLATLGSTDYEGKRIRLAAILAIEREAAAPATEALREYGRHLPECAAIQQSGDFLALCDCGLADRLASPEPTPDPDFRWNDFQSDGPEPTPDTGLTAETLARELEQEFLLNVDPTGLTPHWWQERADAILARLSSTDLTEPTPDTGLDVERLRRAMGTVMGNHMFHFPRDAQAVAVEYARLSPTDPSELE